MEAIDDHYGNCDDRANTFLSLTRVHEEGINCFSLVLSGHVDAICIKDRTISYFDDYGINPRAVMIPTYSKSDLLSESRYILNDYLKRFEPRLPTEVWGIYNYEIYIDFTSTEEYHAWIVDFALS